MKEIGSILSVVGLLTLTFSALAVAIYNNNVSDYRLQELKQFKEQAFARGHMVQCLGRTGFYWECD